MTTAQIALGVIRHFHEREVEYEDEELANAIGEEIDRRKFSQQVKQNARRDFLPEGETFNYARDYKRLARQARDVYDVMKDGQWRTLPDIVAIIGRGTEGGIHARLRDFRKIGIRVDREHVHNGLHTYRVVIPRAEVPYLPPDCYLRETASIL